MYSRLILALLLSSGLASCSAEKSVAGEYLAKKNAADSDGTEPVVGEPPAGGDKGDAAKGLKFVTDTGCLGCHDVKTNPAYMNAPFVKATVPKIDTVRANQAGTHSSWLDLIDENKLDIAAYMESK